MTAYNKYYQKQDYFGNPYPELLEYFDGMDRTKTVVDLGCGQGRDAIALGRLGFQVTGVDVSSVGIEQMNAVATQEGLNVTGVVSDLETYEHLPDYDVILLDSMFHFYKRDIETETNRLQRIVSESKPGADIIIIVQEGSFRINKIKSIMTKPGNDCTILHEQLFHYQEFNSNFYMIVGQR